MKKTLTAIQVKQAIREFVRENYGQSELDVPSWNITALTRAIIERGQ